MTKPATLVAFKTEPYSPTHVCITPYFSGVDRPEGCGIVLPREDRKLASRYKKAFRALADEEVAKNGTLEVKTDVNGKTYVGFHIPVVGRHLNADLIRLGF